jgi:hypothetical protein
MVFQVLIDGQHSVTEQEPSGDGATGRATETSTKSAARSATPDGRILAGVEPAVRSEGLEPSLGAPRSTVTDPVRRRRADAVLEALPGTRAHHEYPMRE